MVEPGRSETLEWRMPELDNMPIAEIGLRVQGQQGSTLYLDSLDWQGAPTVTFSRPANERAMARRAWMNGVDEWNDRWAVDFQISQNHGTGLISQGTEEWADYTARARVRIPLATSAGLAARVGGLRRYYAITLCDDGTARLVKARDGVTTLAESAFAWEIDRDYDLELTVAGNRIRASIDGQLVLDATDDDRPLKGGGIGLVAQDGTLVSGPVEVAAG
jgi:hypothetical protein